MRFYAVITSSEDAPGSPRLEETWPEDMIDGNDEGRAMLARAMSNAWAEPGTLAAGIVTIEVPDGDLLGGLSATAPAVRGTAQAGTIPLA